MRISRAGRLPDPDGALAQLLVNGPAELCTRLFGAPSGAVEEGCIADLVVYDDVPAADPETGYSPHLLGQLARSRVAWTIVNGRVAVREGQLLGLGLHGAGQPPPTRRAHQRVDPRPAASG